MQRKEVIILGLVLLVSVLVGGGVYILTMQDARVPNGIKIATSIFPVYDITRTIVSNKAEVVQVLPNGASPHTYEPTVQDQLKIQQTDLLFMIGLEFDHLVEELVQENNPVVQIVDLSKLIDLHENPTTEDAVDEHDYTHEAEHEEDKHDEHEHGELDPHYFTSITGAKAIAQGVMEAMQAYDPTNATFYQQNYQRYTEQLDDLLAESMQATATLPYEVLITFHNAFAYFAEELGLEVLTTIEPFPGKEPTITYLAEVGRVIQEHQVTALFSEPQLSSAVVDALANDYQIAVYTLDPLGGGIGRDSFIKNYQQNVEIIVNAYQP